MSWWLNTQAGSYSERVRRAIMDTELPVLSVTPAEQANAPESTEADKMSVMVILEKLVSRVHRKAKVRWTTGDPKDIIMGLFEKTWEEVKDEDLNFTPDTFKYCTWTRPFSKTCARSGGPQMWCWL